MNTKRKPMQEVYELPHWHCNESLSPSSEFNMNTNKHDPMQIASELLPWYINGSLSPSETVMVEQALAENEELRMQLNELRQLTGMIADDAPEIPSSDESFKKLQARLQQNGTPASVQQATANAPSGWLEQVREKLSWLLSPAPAFAALGMVLVVSALVINNNQSTEDDFITLSDPADITQHAAENSIIIAFANSETDLIELSELANQVNATAISGPNSVNAYQLYFDNAQLRDQALMQLREKADLRLVEPVQR